MTIQSHTYHTGRLYPKLDSYMVSQRPECKGVKIYMGSSCQFRTQKAYREWLYAQPNNAHLKIIVCRGEE